MEVTLQNPNVSTATSHGGDETSEDDDRISNLPESILHHIFVFLDTIDVIKASAVSRKWRYLWLSVPFLNINISHKVWLDIVQKSSIDTMNGKFKDFVNWVLISQNGSVDIQKFHLSCYNYVHDDYTLYRWINTVARRNVKLLDLKLISLLPIELPYCLVTCQSLDQLKLEFRGHCVLKLPTFSCFSKLRVLELLMVEFLDSVSLQNLVSNCPVLEGLTFENCVFRDFEILDISSTSLMYLSILNVGSPEDGRHGLHSCKLKVACPRLVHFDFRGPSALDYLMENLIYLEEVYILFKCGPDDRDIEKCSYQICKILEGVRDTVELRLALGSVEFFYGLAESDRVIPFWDLKSFTLVIGMGDRHMKSLLYLLVCSPILEDLTIYFQSSESNDCWTLPSIALSCLRNHLKKVQLCAVEGNENQLKLMRFLLEYGVNLQKMSIKWVKDLKNRKEIIKKVKKFPRSSSNVLLRFLEA